MGAVDSEPVGVRRRGRPTAAEAARLDRLVHECALDQFLANGYEGTSMDAVATAAGTTKASLYARYRGKDEMFHAALAWVSARQDWPVPEPDNDDLAGLDEVHDLAGLTDVLERIATAALRRVLHPRMVQLTRLAAAHAARFPELVQHSRLSPWRRYDRIVEMLRRLRVEGVIATDDEPEFLAEDFFAMVTGMPARLALFGVLRSEEEQARRTEVAVRLFVDGLGVGPNG